jgi:hypothetical protein
MQNRPCTNSDVSRLNDGRLSCKNCESIGGTGIVCHYDHESTQSTRNEDGILLATYVENNNMILATATESRSCPNKIMWNATSWASTTEKNDLQDQTYYNNQTLLIMSDFDIESVTRNPLYAKICKFVDNCGKSNVSTYIDVSTGRLVEREGENLQIYVFSDVFCIPDAYGNIHEVLDFCTKFF